MVIQEDEVVVEEEEVVVEDTDETESEESENDQTEDDEEVEDDDEDERVVTIGDPPEEEEEKPKTPGWVKATRKANRRLESENKQLKRQLEERSTASEKPPELGEAPTLKSCKYDQKKFETELLDYHDRKRKVEAFEAEKKKAVEEQQERWGKRQTRYNERKVEHSFKDFGEAEELVSNTFDVTQQGIIVQGAEDSALVVYALGKNPKKLEELAKVTDPVEFAVAIGRLESQLRVTNRKAPPPEKRVSGKTGGTSGDETLERLREEAVKTGDYTKVRQYKANKHKE
jgi:hypothetical protein